MVLETALRCVSIQRCVQSPSSISWWTLNQLISEFEMTREPDPLTDEEREALEEKIDEQSELLRETLTEEEDDDGCEDTESPADEDGA
jgi:hypothetical protein